ncbi:MAG: type II secretion system protein [Planctomycetota bacterium]|nr:type II secretion system protein [Planctomycetota bacterium]MDA1137442.1 type II secretion system protein [Planctomycetota bacterium]
MKTRSGLTLIEIMIVLSVVSVIAILAIPNVLRSRLSANETMAINTLKYLSMMQEEFQQALEHNVDNDDVGEYGTFAMLSGAKPTSNGEMKEPYLDARFQQETDGVVEVSGYRFKLFLPDKERMVQGRLSRVTDEKEVFWCAFAWPGKPGESGERVFFINQSNLIFSKNFKEVELPVMKTGIAYTGEPLSGDIDVANWVFVR